MLRSTWPAEVTTPGIDPVSEYCHMTKSNLPVGWLTPYSAYYTS